MHPKLSILQISVALKIGTVSTYYPMLLECTKQLNNYVCLTTRFHSILKMKIIMHYTSRDMFSTNVSQDISNYTQQLAGLAQNIKNTFRT